MEEMLHYKLIEIASDEKNIVRPVKSRELEIIMKEYSLTEQEAVVFSFVLKMSFERNYINLERFESDEVKKGDRVYIRILKDLRSLEKKNMLLLNSENSRRRGDALNPTIQIDEAVFTKIVLGEDIFSGVDFSDIYSVIEAADDLINKRIHKKVSEDRFFSDMDSLVKKMDKKLNLTKIVMNYTNIEQAMIFRACLNKLTGDHPDTCNDFINNIYESLRATAFVMSSILKNNLGVFKNKVLRFEETGRFGMFVGNPDFELTDKSYEKIFETKDKKLKRELRTVYTEHISYKSIKKELYFDNELKGKVDVISGALSNERFKTVTKKLKDGGYAPGVVSLLYGSPGTGKTATVHEIARATKRDILQVDISNIKDKYVGESEKRLKEVFKEYKKAVKYLPRTPILLFNEADALIGRRVDVERSVDSMYNAMQNIILEELEKFEGIFFATTNLTQNMDDAFSRRFLYKVEFTKPSSATRKFIWQSKMKELPENWIDKLTMFELSGGQIDNIARKYLIDSILGIKSGYDILESMCREESEFKRETRNSRIGFGRT